MSNYRYLSFFQLSVKNHGVVIKDGESVKEIIPGSNVTVKTNNGVYMSKRVIVTAGPWSCDLLKPLGVHLPLKVNKNVHDFNVVCTPKASILRCANRDALGVHRGIYMYWF